MWLSGAPGLYFVCFAPLRAEIWDYPQAAEKTTLKFTNFHQFVREEFFKFEAFLHNRLYNISSNILEYAKKILDSLVSLQKCIHFEI